MSKRKEKTKIQMFVDACGKAHRDLEIKNGGGFKSAHKVHRNKKKYSRKKKHKNNLD